MAGPAGYNLARFDLVSIRLAVACAQGGSLTAAAREAHLALAAASRRIKDLEGAVGAPLFERHARGLVPTAEGRVFVKHGLALMQTLEQLGAELADMRQGIARHIRLCASTASINQFLPQLLARYARLEPQVRIDLEEQVSEAVVASLREGRADLGLFVEGRLRMQVRSFDAVCHLVASGLGLAVLPKAAALPIIKAMKLDWRPLADSWARRRLLVATGTTGADRAVEALLAFLVEPSQTAKPRPRKKQ